jgi:hypothetical protein
MYLKADIKHNILGTYHPSEQGHTTQEHKKLVSSPASISKWFSDKLGIKLLLKQSGK